MTRRNRKEAISRPKSRRRRHAGPRTLSIDIGGTGLKAAVLDRHGRMASDRIRVPTPDDAPPRVLIAALDELVADLPAFDRVSVGFPGVVRDGRILTAHNLGTDAWRGYRLADVLARRWHKPVRVANDADVQGLGVVRGKGIEMVITLGTGFGSALFEHGRLLPHLEFAHHPVTGGRTYEEYLGDAALETIGRRHWSRRVKRAIARLRALVTFDRLYIGGGNARFIRFTPDRDVRVVSNRAGILGGIALWR